MSAQHVKLTASRLCTAHVRGVPSLNLRAANRTFMSDGLCPAVHAVHGAELVVKEPVDLVNLLLASPSTLVPLV